MSAEKQYDTYLIDWDGTTASTLQLWLDSLRQAHAKRNLYPSDQEIATGFGDWQRFAELGVADMPAFTKEVLASAQKACATPTLYPGAKEKLTELRETGKHVALISSSPRAFLDEALEYTGLRDVFSLVVAAEDVAHHKPHPESVELALQQLGSSASRAVLFGDSDKDLGAAQNASVDSVFFFPPEHALFYNKDELAHRFHPVRTIASWQEL